MVPTGTFSTMLSPSRPVLLEPSPCRPRSALYWGLKRKGTSVLCRSLDSITTSPPWPPSPAEGPPRGTNFSRRKAMQPLPPSPAFTRILASSTNIGKPLRKRNRIGQQVAYQRQNHDRIIMTPACAYSPGKSDKSDDPSQGFSLDDYFLAAGEAARTLTRVPSGSGFPRNSTMPLRTTPLSSGIPDATPPTSVALTAGALFAMPRSMARFA